jgi:hypothetical protein
VIAFTQAIENSIELDYVTEKVYHALESGCIPVYYGAPNVNDYIPDEAGIINYAQLRSPAALLAELERVAFNETAYNEKLAWRKKSLQQLAPGDALACHHCAVLHFNLYFIAVQFTVLH